MKSIKLICWLILIFLLSCETTNVQPVSEIDKLIAKNKQKITISTGLSGTLLKKEGDCMPSPGTTSTGKYCKEYPVSRTIFIYEYTFLQDVVG